MFKAKPITAIDIGTSLIKVLVARKEKEGLEILAKTQIPSFGVRKGEVIKINKVAENIQAAIDKIEKEFNFKIKSCFCNINGAHLHSLPSQGLVSVSRADQKISEEDIERVFRQTQAINLASNKEILDIFPKEFIIDGEGGIKEPLGLSGVRLEVKVLLICAFSPFLENLTKALLSTGIQIADVIPSPLASSFACLTPEQKELGVALVDIGAETTGLAVFEEGDLIDLAVFPIGSANITNDIALGLRTEIDTAEQIKKEFCSLSKEKRKLKKGMKKEKREKIEIPEKFLVFSKKILDEIVYYRIGEIFDQIQKELKKISKQELLPAGVVLTGGGSLLSGIDDYAKEKIKLPCRLAKFGNNINLEENDLSFSTALGLLKSSDLNEKKDIKENFGSGVKKFFKIFLPQ